MKYRASVLVFFVMSIFYIAAFPISTDVDTGARVLSLIVGADIIIVLWSIFTLRKSPDRGMLIVFFIFSTALMIYTFARVYNSLGVLESGKAIYEWDVSFYFSVITWTSLGYGDVAPTVLARPWVTAQVMIGYLHLGLFIAVLSDTLIKNSS